MFLLFTTPMCPNCPRAKQLVQEKDIDVNLIDASTPEGLDLARKYSVAQVPTLLEVDENEEVLNQHSGIEAIINGLE